MGLQPSKAKGLIRTWFRSTQTGADRQHPAKTPEMDSCTADHYADWENQRTSRDNWE